MKTAEVRDAYLKFFEGHGHKVVPSSTLVPHNDPTLLFTNAGMNQFKDPLLGRSDPGYRRATSSQRCVRAGGKHNDLENVGYTARHHTFFEMLGNFSFGDYFKEETITWAWEFVSQVLGLPAEKIWVTVHPTDDDARKLWVSKIGIPQERVIDLEENFWTMGDTGPCGPCTELFYDHGPEVFGGPPGSPDEDGDRYIEFWNLVFPQFDRSEDGSLAPLPSPGVDTGMGLERITAIMQGVHSNYEIDLFRNLLAAAGKYAGISDPDLAIENPSLRVIADHIRSSAFLIADGVMPGNEDRAYVLRRIIRRGLRHGHKLNIEDLFFHKLVDPLVEEMGEAFPTLVENQQKVKAALENEENRFSETLRQGMEVFQNKIANLKGDVIPGDVVFQLYDTYGFPADLTADVARERGLQVDMPGFEAAMEEQRERGRAATSFSASLNQKISVAGSVDFSGYESTVGAGTVVSLFDEAGEPLDVLRSGQAGVVILDRSPFYAEAGGQVGDQGVLTASGVEFAVADTQVTGDQHMHIGSLAQGDLTVGITLESAVNAQRREAIKRNHSATHLLHAALRKVLGTHVQQKGSLVTDDKLRFDFSHDKPVSEEEILAIEEMVNAEIRRNTSVQTELMAADDAVAKGAMALFGEKYGDEVRVLTMGDGYSVELCGGTHVSRTGDIGLLKILSESGIAAGVRRVEAVAGAGAETYVTQQQTLLQQAAQKLKVPPAQLGEKVAALVEDNRALQKQIEELSQKLSAAQGSDLAQQQEQFGDVKALLSVVQGDAKAMMQTLDNLRSQLGQCVVVLACEDKGKVNLVCAVSPELTDRVTAPELMEIIGPAVGARGGGRDDLARAGGGSNIAGFQEGAAQLRSLLSGKFDA